MQQMKEQKKAQAAGTLKISPAALALNNMEMGLESKDSKQEEDDIVGISSDQLYTNFGQTDKKTIQTMSKQKESAAITMAKKAASQFITSHPDVLTQKIDVTKPARLVEKKDDQANLEIDQTETSDIYSSIRADNETKLEDIATGDKDEKYILNVEETKTDEDDLSVPKWPVYSNPAAQHDQIEKELAEVTKTEAHWNSLLEEA